MAQYYYQGLPAVICGVARTLSGAVYFDVRVAELHGVVVVRAQPDELEPAEWDGGDQALLDTLPPEMAGAFRTGDLTVLSRERLGLEEILPPPEDAADLADLAAEAVKKQ